MADDPMIDRELGSVKSRGYTLATIAYEKFKSANEDKHRVLPNHPYRLADPWHKWHFDNRLDSAWWDPPFAGKNGKALFKVEEKPVPDGDGEVQIKWTVWENPLDMNTVQVELYSVMRAEHKYISAGWQKIASKYFSVKGGFPTEACGIDSFFMKDKQYIVCESKFTSNESKFAGWKADEKKVWKQLNKDKGKPRQMSWEWIEDRAARAVQDPPINIPKRTDAQNAAVIQEINVMARAIRKEKIKRVVNVYGSAKVPIYQGRYKIKCADRAKLSLNVLHLTWDLGIDDAEFITLGKRFDDFVEEEDS